MKEIKTIKDIPKEELLTGGTFACSGCQSIYSIRLLLKALGKKTILFNAAGCMTLTTNHPFTPYKVPWVFNAIENAASTASGVYMGLKAFKKNKDVNIVCHVGDGACYSKDTEIFTEFGFKNVKNIKTGENVWSVNPLNNQLELVCIEKLHKYFYKGKMIRGRSNFIDFLITPNHNFPIWYNNKWKFILAGDLKKRYKTTTLRSFIWKGKKSHKFVISTIKKTNQKIYNLNKISLKKFLRFLGWYISEGCLYKSKAGYLVRIYQTNKKKRKIILKLLSDLGFKPFECNRSVDFQSKQIYDLLEKECGKGTKNKKIPKWVLELDKEYLVEIFKSLMAGDGHIGKQKNRKAFHMVYVTISKSLMNNFIELVIKLGKNCNIWPDKSAYRIGININYLKHKLYSKRSLYEKQGTKQILEEDYEGYVYCPQLPKNHTVIIKRNGKISLNGNSYDIGFQALSGIFQRNEKIIYICYNNSSFANTGYQRTAATPYGARTSTTPIGKLNPVGNLLPRKHMAKIIVAHGALYVATACTSYPLDFIKKIQKASKINGPTFIDVLCPCMPGWMIKDDEGPEIGRLAVETGAWPIYEIENGKFTLNIKPESLKPVKEYLTKQGRFKHLRDNDINYIQSIVSKQWELLLKGDYWNSVDY